MKLITKSEFFKFDKPIGEPELTKNWSEPNYSIERKEYITGRVAWFGQDTNWVTNDGKNWTTLAKYIQRYQDIRGIWVEGHYENGVNGRRFIDCEMPIYEKLYNELKTK